MEIAILRGPPPPPPRFLGSIPKKRGAPKGNRNALKHGRYTKEMEKLRAEARLTVQKIKASLALLAARASELPPVTYRVTRHAADLAPDEGCSR